MQKHNKHNLIHGYPSLKDVLPLLLAPGPAIALLASNAIQAVHTQFAHSPALAQFRALAIAVRWDISIDSKDFLGNVLEGDRWLVQAAGTVRPYSLRIMPFAPCVARSTRMGFGGANRLKVTSRQKSHQLRYYLLMQRFLVTRRMREGEQPYGTYQQQIGLTRSEL